jgi:hypothetical protein
MKKCPQCNSVYEDETIYCLKDGAQLREESFSLPSSAADTQDDEPTLFRSKPIVIDLSSPDAPHASAANPPVPPPPPPAYENIIVVPANAGSANRNYALVLVIGLLIGGGLVLGTLLLSRNLNQETNTDPVRTNAPVVKTEKSKASPEAQNKKDAGFEEAAPALPNKHAEPNDDAAESANGRVIARNARVRLAPEKDAPVVDTVPMNDRIDIIRRENENSLWYQIECEHGTGGWMHGDTIEFTQ